MATEIPEGKVFDLATQGWVDKPEAELNKEAKSPEEIAAEAETKHKADEVEAKRKADEDAARIANAGKSADQIKAEADKKAQDDLVKKKADEEAAKSQNIGNYLKEKFSEKFGIESEADLQAVLEANQKLADELEAEKKKDKSPIYKSEKEEKIHKFLGHWDLDKLDQGLETAASIIGMDVATANGKRVLQEAYVLERPHMTRDKAIKMFNYDFDKEWTLDKEKFEGDDSAYDKEKEQLDLRREDKEARARQLLLTKQGELKSKPVEKVEQAKPFEIPKESLAEYTNGVEKVFKDFDRYVFEDENDKDIKVNLVLPPEYIKTAKTAALEHIKRAENYSNDGKISNFSAEQIKNQIIHALYGDELLQMVFRDTLTYAKTLRAEQLAGIKPDKESRGGGGGAPIPSIEQQFEDLGKKEVELRAKNKR